MHHHRMSFYWSTDVGEFMFPGLDINGTGPFIGLCVVLIISTLVFEAVKIIQTKSKSKTAREVVQHDRNCPSSRLITNNGSSGSSSGNSETRLQQNRRQFWNRVAKVSLQTFVFLFQTVLGYLLMLAVMAYNGPLFLVVMLGFGVGYFIFGHYSMKINMENVRARKTHVICSPSNYFNEPSTHNGRSGTNSSTNSNNKTNRDGYTNELAISSSSSSLSNSLTQTTNLDKEIDYHHHQDDNDSNIVQSCRL